MDSRANRDLAGTLIADIVLPPPSCERTFIRRRQGVDAAKGRGRRFGPPGEQLTESCAQLAGAWRERRITAHGAG